jgi:hypothetical protein
MANVAIIDADVIAYLACKTRKEVSGGFFQVREDTTPINYTPEEDAAYLQQCWKNCKQLMNFMIEVCFADYSLAAVKSSKNFRDDLYPDYKANRTTANAIVHKNPFVPILRQMMIDEGLAIEAIGREADDLIRIWATEAAAAGHTYTIMSIDKDLKCIPGNHYNMKLNEHFYASPDYSLRFFYEQLLKGDPTDNIPGIPRVGDVKATALLAAADSEEEYQWIVVREYQRVYGDNWRHYLLINGKLLYLQVHVNDYFHIRDWTYREYNPDNFVVEKKKTKSVKKIVVEVPIVEVAPVVTIKHNFAGLKANTQKPNG